MTEPLSAKRKIGFLLLGAFILRLGFFLPGLLRQNIQCFIRPDSGEYIRGMWFLAHSYAYPVTARPPGVAVLGAAVLKLGGSLFIYSFIAVVLSTLTVWVIYLAIKEYADERAALIGAGLGAFYLTAIAAAPLILSDTLFALIAAGEFYCFLRFWKRGQFRFGWASALLAGIGVLVRPINLLHLVVLPILTCFAPTSRKARWQSAAGEVVLFALVVVPWMSFNYHRGAGFAVDTNTGAMLHQNGAMLLAEVNKTDFESEKSRLLAWESAEFADRERYPDAASREKFRIQEYRKLVLAHPVVALKQQLLNFPILLPDLPGALELLGVTASDRGTMGVMAKEGVLAAIRHYLGGRYYLVALSLPFLLVHLDVFLGVALALWGIFRAFSTQYRELLLFAGFGLYYLWLPGAIVAPRYQLPALPVMLLLAGVAWSRQIEKKSLAKAAR